MPFWIHGRDGQTGQATDPLFSEAVSEEAARAEATAQGMIVESVERHIEIESSIPDESPANPSADSRESPARPGGGFVSSPELNAVIKSLAWYMNVFGVVLMLFGGLQLVTGMIANRSGSPAPFVQGLLALVLGGLTTGVASAFRQAVETRGRDAGHLMDAFVGLKLLYAIQVWVIGIAMVIVALVMLRAVGAK